MSRTTYVLSVAASLVGAIVLAAACVTTSTAEPCRNVPAGGCPLSNGVACDDPSCAAAYACNPDGTWTLDHPCPGYVAPADAGSDGGDASDATPAPLFDASGFDAPPGTFGGSCSPPLEDDDCQLGLALGCPPGNVDPCCGCDGLFVCLPDGTWQAWGYCSADAGLVYAP